ncbi:MAG: SRPBCC family protein [Pyrinomonadaceae bacterium]
MPAFVLETWINASPETCFDLMRDVRLHTKTTAQTNEKVVAGVTEGKIGLGQTVTFEGTHFGIRQRLTVKVVEFERPDLFVDEMIEGTLEVFRHVHEFSSIDGGTLMRDTLSWRSPFGFLGRLADKLFIESHLRELVIDRNAILKEIAESGSSGGGER